MVFGIVVVVAFVKVIIFGQQQFWLQKYLAQNNVGQTNLDAKNSWYNKRFCS